MTKTAPQAERFRRACCEVIQQLCEERSHAFTYADVLERLRLRLPETDHDFVSSQRVVARLRVCAGRGKLVEVPGTDPLRYRSPSSHSLQQQENIVFDPNDPNDPLFGRPENFQPPATKDAEDDASKKQLVDRDKLEKKFFACLKRLEKPEDMARAQTAGLTIPATREERERLTDEELLRLSQKTDAVFIALGINTADEWARHLCDLVAAAPEATLVAGVRSSHSQFSEEEVKQKVIEMRRYRLVHFRNMPDSETKAWIAYLEQAGVKVPSKGRKSNRRTLGVPVVQPVNKRTEDRAEDSESHSPSILPRINPEEFRVSHDNSIARERDDLKQQKEDLSRQVADLTEERDKFAVEKKAAEEQVAELKDQISKADALVKDVGDAWIAAFAAVTGAKTLSPEAVEALKQHVAVLEKAQKQAEGERDAARKERDALPTAKQLATAERERDSARWWRTVAWSSFGILCACLVGALIWVAVERSGRNAAIDRAWEIQKHYE